MLLVQDVLVSEEVVTEQFVCNLEACKGACCWEGDFGAPLEEQELKILEDILHKVLPYLSEESKNTIAEIGTHMYYKDTQEHGTTLLDNGACVFMTYDSNSIAQCGIEQAWKDGVIDFKKPISCHLYPIRVNVNRRTNFEALNYDEWDICSAACSLGKSLKVPVYQFLKEPIIRKYGIDFFNELHEAAKYMKDRNKEEND